MAKAEKNGTTDRKGLLVNLRPETQAFIKAAAGNRPMSTFVRESAIKAAEKVNGKPAPAVAEFGRGGRSTEITVAAQKAGLSTKEFMKKCALEAMGKKYAPPAAVAPVAKSATK